MERLEPRALGRPTEHIEVETGNPVRKTMARRSLGERRAMLLGLNHGH
jgi:hypothetical protein